MNEIVKIDRINNFEYSFKLSSQDGIRNLRLSTKYYENLDKKQAWVTFLF